jgi:hypothetical protein
VFIDSQYKSKKGWWGKQGEKDRIWGDYSSDKQVIKTITKLVQQ